MASTVTPAPAAPSRPRPKVLEIATFTNGVGGNAFYKAITHPLAGDRASDLLRRLGEAGPVAVYDPEGQASLFNLFYDLEELVTAGTYVQAVTQAGRPVLGHPAQLITELPRSGAGTLLVAAFDAERTIGHIRHLLPEGCTVASFDALRLPATMLSNPKRTLDPNNYATNFVFFRSTDDDRMRLVTVNYWAGYGASSLRLWCRLYDTAGQVLAEWEEPVAPGISTTTLDSAEVRRRFDLPPFTGQLFVHAIGATGHDMVKYALDTLGGEGDPLECFSATHDANAWPADFYGGLPAPRDGEQVILWLQNSHPTAIPAGAIGLARMGEEAVRTLPLEIPPFGTHPLSVADLFPEDRWPTQYEVHAGRHFVRPRYEVLLASGRRCVAHINVERTDLKPDPALASLPKELGKGFLLPAPILPPDRFRTTILPTPMATCQRSLPLAVACYAPDGTELLRKPLGNLPRRGVPAVAIGDLLGEALQGLPYGHLELLYDFSQGGEADGWLHGLFRYEDIATGHQAETSFGAHIFNTVVTYRDEPQSYTGKAPGLSTRLFLRLGNGEIDTLCHLIYPASAVWHTMSATQLQLHNAAGELVVGKPLAIPCGGSVLWRYHDLFSRAERAAAGEGAYLVVRDTTCRLFGYHGLEHPGGAFSFDHMFGF